MSTRLLSGLLCLSSMGLGIASLSGCNTMLPSLPLLTNAPKYAPLPTQCDAIISEFDRLDDTQRLLRQYHKIEGENVASALYWVDQRTHVDSQQAQDLLKQRQTALLDRYHTQACSPTQGTVVEQHSTSQPQG